MGEIGMWNGKLTVVTPIAPATTQRVLRDEGPASQARHQEAVEPERLGRRVPVVAPVPAPVQVPVGVVGVPEPGGDLHEREVVDGVLDGAADGAAVRRGDVPAGEPVGQGAAPLGRGPGRVARVVVVGGRGLGVGHHGAVPVGPVDGAAHALDVGVGQDVVRVGAPLRGAVPEGGARVREEAHVSPDVDQGADVLFVRVGLEDVEEGGATAELSQREGKYVGLTLALEVSVGAYQIP